MLAVGTPEDTICAIATSAGEGGIGIVRISGPNAVDIGSRVVRLRSKQSLQTLVSHKLHLADILFAPVPSMGSRPAPETGLSTERIIDEGLVVYMKAPRSFTAEDVIEIHCHGSWLVLQRVCEACVAAGARLAQAGEFTKRAFLNGRLDLSQAEAVLDTIKAKSELGLKLAQRQLRGELTQQVHRLRTRLVGLLAHLEAGIDFAAEDITFIGRKEMIVSLQETLAHVRQMLATAETGRLLRDGVRVVISGEPNVGKSSLLNSLLRESRAIVTDIPGTTRDIIEESVIWFGLQVTLVDTAGLRDTTDLVELEGIRRSKEAQNQADIVLHVLDGAQLAKRDIGTIRLPSLVHEHLCVVNKIDLVDAATIQPLSDALRAHTKCKVFPISAQTGEGLNALKQAIRAQFVKPSLEPNDGVVITHVRHRVALERAEGSLQESLASIERGLEPEFVAVDLRGAADALGEIVGAITSDEVLDQIFSEFCIGK
ncbi:MAG: tRNA-5-carboxymethylaminomethyl-2-thiouridine(34) synthesis protein MnmE [Nitrospira sp.]|jgi:tRNA modification GTPase|nr:MAG: tRNA-5-carboxymethylaminomethyl-2-thiouridine(34) synthesis protein MnmE [Nitrospira sp.]